MQSSSSRFDLNSSCEFHEVTYKKIFHSAVESKCYLNSKGFALAIALGLGIFVVYPVLSHTWLIKFLRKTLNISTDTSICVTLFSVDALSDLYAFSAVQSYFQLLENYNLNIVKQFSWVLFIHGVLSKLPDYLAHQFSFFILSLLDKMPLDLRFIWFVINLDLIYPRSLITNFLMWFYLGQWTCLVCGQYLSIVCTNSKYLT